MLVFLSGVVAVMDGDGKCPTTKEITSTFDEVPKAREELKKLAKGERCAFKKHTLDLAQQLLEQEKQRELSLIAGEEKKAEMALTEQMNELARVKVKLTGPLAQALTSGDMHSATALLSSSGRQAESRLATWNHMKNTLASLPASTRKTHAASPNWKMLGFPGKGHAKIKKYHDTKVAHLGSAVDNARKALTAAIKRLKSATTNLHKAEDAKLTSTFKDLENQRCGKFVKKWKPFKKAKENVQKKDKEKKGAEGAKERAQKALKKAIENAKKGSHKCICATKEHIQKKS